MTMAETTTIPSKHSVAVTMDRLASVAESRGMRIFCRIDHALNGMEVGMPLRPTLLLIFGNPKGGTPLMQDKQVAGLDLPVRALAWQDEADRVWLSYDTGSAIAARRGLGPASAAAVAAMDQGITMLCSLAAGEDVAPRKT